MRTLSIDPKVLGTTRSTTRSIVVKSYWSGTLNLESSARAGGGAEASGGPLAVDGTSRVQAARKSRVPIPAHASVGRNAVGWGRRRSPDVGGCTRLREKGVTRESRTLHED